MTCRAYIFKLVILPIYIGLISPHTALAVDTIELLQRGQNAFEQGAFMQATQYWEVALKEPTSSLQYIDFLIKISTAYQELNQPTKAYQWLQEAETLAEQQGSLAQQALIYSQLGEILLTLQKPKKAEAYLQKGLILLKAASEPFARTHLQNNFGYLDFLQKNYHSALKHYQQAIQSAAAHGDVMLLVQSLIYQSWVYVKQDDKQAALTAFKKALTQIQQQPASYKKARLMVDLGYLDLQIQASTAHLVLEETVSLVKKYQNKVLLACALGYLGQAYEQRQRFDKALALTERAIQLSQGMDNLRYHWEWQRGRLLRAQNDLPGATSAYKQALTYKQALHYPLLADPIEIADIFKTYIHPVYQQLLDVLFQQAAGQTNTAFLEKIRETLEQSAIATIKDYFREMPLQNRHALVNSINHLKEGNAVLYLLSLPDRLELLLVSPNGFFHETTSITAATLRQTVQQFNQSIHEPEQRQFIKPAIQLYQWLIAPLRFQLMQQQIDTLIIVPEGILLTLPFSALFDNLNQAFLVEQFALAITPSLNLTVPCSSILKQNVLLAGLADMKKGYKELKTALHEITNINTLFKTDTLLDSRFTLEHLQENLQTDAWSILHIASHCRISSAPADTFILTFDGVIGLNQLAHLLNISQQREHALELLTLSYCQVATNDEAAFLGLTSLIFKVDIHSLLVNLWFIDDTSTITLMKVFYENLLQAKVSKAQALQRAQLELLKHSTFQHPYYWATFQLIGHWF